MSQSKSNQNSNFKKNNNTKRYRATNNKNQKESYIESSNYSGVKKRKVNSSKSKRSKNRIGTITCLGFFIIIIIIFSSIAGIGFGVFTRIIESSPNLDLITVEPNVYTSIVYDMNGGEIDRFHGQENREYVTLDQISINLQNAIVSVEDERFYSHFGIDIKGIIRAGYTTIKNKIKGSVGVQGASTITQQLIKNNVTKVNRNSLETKIQEQYLAVNYEKKLEEKRGSKRKAKEYILELYLNTIGLGHGYNGVQAASLGYFNKDAKDLTLAESATIAGITNNPSLYSPRTKPENNKKRQIKILNHMLDQGMISKLEYDQALTEDVYSKIRSDSSKKKVEGNVIHTYFADSVFEQVSKDLQEEHNISSSQAEHLIYSGGLQIYSTLEPRVQNIVDMTYQNQDLFPNVPYKIDVTYTVSIEDTKDGTQNHTDYRQFVKTKEDGETFVSNKRSEIEKSLSVNEKIIADKATFSIQPQSSMVIMDYKTGVVRAIAGGRDEKIVNRGFNRAIDSERQPGSVFKVLAAYAPAIDMGVLMPGSIIIDEPFTKGKYSPSNWYGEKYRGPSTVRDGIRNSMNILAVKAMDMVGVDAAYNYLLNFGFTTLEDDRHLSTALGGITYGVTQLEVTAAYGAIANLGKYYEPKFYTKVLDHDGNIILDTTQREPKQILKETTSFLLTDMMKDVVISGTGTAAKFKNVKIPIAGKTGTTQETKDLTFVGYTPYYVSGIWLGYDRYDKTVPNMSRILKNERYHLVLWREIMEQVHKDLPNVNFPPSPQGISKFSICLDTGLIATDLCRNDPRKNRVITDYFVEGTEPEEECEMHKVIYICKDSGKLLGDFCPSRSKQVKSVMNLDQPITELCDIHLEGSIIDDPDKTTESTAVKDEQNKENSTFIINPFDPLTYSSESLTERITETTTLPEEFGNIIPSVPEEQTTNTETTTKAPTFSPIIEETIGDPIIQFP